MDDRGGVCHPRGLDEDSIKALFPFEDLVEDADEIAADLQTEAQLQNRHQGGGMVAGRRESRTREGTERGRGVVDVAVEEGRGKVRK